LRATVYLKSGAIKLQLPGHLWPGPRVAYPCLNVCSNSNTSWTRPRCAWCICKTIP